jgi:ribosomal protein S18 acetylase RimI-like enzyme
MSDITIRPMREKDIAEAAGIHRRFLEDGLIQRAEYSIEDLFAAFIGHSPKTCLIAVENDVVVGFIVGDVKEWGFGVERTGWIEIVGVSPEHMGKGIGKALGEALIQYFKSEGIKEVYTSVRWDSGDLIEFFKSIGFDKSGFINLIYE